MTLLEQTAREELSRTGLSQCEQQEFAREISDVVAKLIGGRAVPVGGALPGSRFRETHNCESVKFSTGPDNGQEGGRAATSDCKLQLEAVWPPRSTAPNL